MKNITTVEAEYKVNANWFEDLSKEAQAEYLKKNPGSKYAKGGKPKAEVKKNITKPTLTLKQRVFNATKKANGYTDAETREHLNNRGPDMEDLPASLQKEIQRKLSSGKVNRQVVKEPLTRTEKLRHIRSIINKSSEAIKIIKQLEKVENSNPKTKEEIIKSNKKWKSLEDKLKKLYESNPEYKKLMPK